MAVLTVSRDGQMTIPSDLLATLGIGPGAEVEVGQETESRLYIEVVSRAHKPYEVADLLGCTDYRGPVIAVEDMDPALALRNDGDS